MSIIISQDRRLFTLHTRTSTYQMKVDAYGFLLHLYYGPRVEDADFSYLLQYRDRGFSGNPADVYPDRRISTDTMPLEFSCCGNGDFRESCLEIINGDGSNSVDLRFDRFRILPGKPMISGLPATYASDEEADTLEITLRDRVSGICAVLQYCVVESGDFITRRVRIINEGTLSVVLLRALSCCLDFMQNGARELITFYGRHAGERTMEREQLRHGKKRIDSSRGASSLHYNPVIILCDADTTETAGECFGMMLVYSGSFLAQAELDQICQTRLVMGINPQGFQWALKSGDFFDTPEVVLGFSGDGLDALSNRFHAMVNNHLIRGPYKNVRRPVLINNWEATYFDFNDHKLVEIAKQAKELGVELFVLDDGWFGDRNGDTCSLGDWYVNPQKLRGGLSVLSEKIHDMGMKFGIWLEPEMISLDSNLYRAHPDWMMAIPGRPPVSSRCQFVLDMSRPEVIDYLFSSICRILDEGRIDYVKWDMNRNISDVWSNACSSNRQGEVLHRYMLGVYALLDKVLSAFPNLLLETCSGGGGRFDAGMLYYSPQIWCSDNTDPIERLSIQYGTSFAYPCASVGAHVSASPNHQTGRTTPLNTRGIVAMSGTFGYELDPSKLSDKEKEEIKEQISIYKDNWKLFAQGSYHRLTGNPHSTDFCAWMHVSQNRESAVVSYVFKSTTANAPVTYLRLRGLNPEMVYSVSTMGAAFSGKALMSAGLSLPEPRGDYPAVHIFLHRV